MQIRVHVRTTTPPRRGSRDMARDCIRVCSRAVENVNLRYRVIPPFDRHALVVPRRCARAIDLPAFHWRRRSLRLRVARMRTRSIDRSIAARP